VEGADVGMIQGRDGAGFAFEASAEPRRRDFDGHSAVKARVSGLVDGAHAAGAKRSQNLVRTKLRAGLQRAFAGGLPKRLIEHAHGRLLHERFHFAAEVWVAAAGFFQKRGTQFGRPFECGMVQLLDLPPSFGDHTSWCRL
jgi:hypothetical protein